MAKHKRDRAAHDDASGASRSATTTPSGPVVLRFEVPYAAAAPRLIEPAIGLASLVPAHDPRDTYTIDVTLLDSPDHRLIRCGLLLAHRVRDGMGEWYLGASGWEPTLGGEQTEAMGAGDLPERFADLVRPFRRIGALGPVAALTADRRVSVFTDVAGRDLATLRDERVTVRRGGLTTARFREVTITPTTTLDDAQQEFLVRTLTGLGASLVPDFPALVQRLGAPATGRSDYPDPRPLDADEPVASWLANLIATRLRAIVEADLAIRQGDPTTVPTLRRTVRRLRTELSGLTTLLDADWLADVTDDLDWLTDGTESELPQRLRAERYLTLLEQLVTASRVPQVGHVADDRAKPALRALLHAAAARFATGAAAATLDAPDDAWVALAASRKSLLDTAVVVGHLAPKPARKVRDVVDGLADGLPAAVGADLGRLPEQAASADGTTAFELGRRYERELASRVGARQDWQDRWQRVAGRLPRSAR